MEKELNTPQQNALNNFRKKAGPLGVTASEELAFLAGWKRRDDLLLGTRILIRDVLKAIREVNPALLTVSQLRQMVNLRRVATSLGMDIDKPLFDFSAEIKAMVQKYAPLRVVLRKAEGKWEGLVEESFCMSTSDSHVYIWWSGPAYGLGAPLELNGPEDAKSHVKPGDAVYDPLDAFCPVEIDWEAWLIAETKYGKRNAPFKVRPVEEEDGSLL